MLLELPHTAWLMVLNHLGLFGSCRLRQVHKSIKTRMEDTVRQLYKGLEGQQYNNMATLSHIYPKWIYPEIHFKSVISRTDYYKHVKMMFQIKEYNILKLYIIRRNVFRNPMHFDNINNQPTNKLIRAFVLNRAGLSDHYINECMPLSNAQIDVAIKLKSQNIADIFCYKGASKFTDIQIKNFVRVQPHTFQDYFAFIAAESLADSQIDQMIQNKKNGLIDYDALRFV